MRRTKLSSLAILFAVPALGRKGVRNLSWPDRDSTTGPGVCDVLDFICFQAAFAASCEKE